MSNKYPEGDDPSLTPPNPLKVSGRETAPNHTPIAIIGGVALAAVISFWIYHFSTASNPTSPATNNTLAPWTTGSAR
jgi:hypothetical protein